MSKRCLGIRDMGDMIQYGTLCLDLVFDTRADMRSTQRRALPLLPQGSRIPSVMPGSQGSETYRHGSVPDSTTIRLRRVLPRWRNPRRPRRLRYPGWPTPGRALPHALHLLVLGLELALEIEIELSFLFDALLLHVAYHSLMHRL